MQTKPFRDAVTILFLGLVVSVSPALIACSTKSKQAKETKEAPSHTVAEQAASDLASPTPEALAIPARENPPRHLRVVRATAGAGGGELFGVIDETGKLIVPMGERSIREAFDVGDGQVYLAIGTLTRVGLIAHEEKGAVPSQFDAEKWVVPPQYGELRMYSSQSLNAVGGPYVVSGSAEKVFLYNLKGEELKTGRSITLYDSPEFDKMGGPFLTVTEEKDGPCEIISLRTGERIHSETLWRCEMGPGIFPVLVASPEKRYGYMNAKGEMVIPAQFVSAQVFHEGRAQVAININYAIALCGGWHSGSPPEDLAYNGPPPKGDKDIYVESCSRGLSYWLEYLDVCEMGMVPASECEGEPLGNAYIDEQGNIASLFDYDETFAFSDGHARIGRFGRWGFIAPTGNCVIGPGNCDTDPQFLHAEDFSEGKAVVKTFVNAPDGRALEGRMMTESNYREETVSLDTPGVIPESAFITKDGAFWIRGLCDAKSFNQGFAYVRSCDAARGAYINHEGKQVIANVGPGDVTIHQERLWGPDHKLGGYGAIDKHGQWLTPYRLAGLPGISGNSIYFVIDGTLFNQKNAQGLVYSDGWIDEQGNIIWPPGWNDPCTDTQGYVIWPDGACR